MKSKGSSKRRKGGKTSKRGKRTRKGGKKSSRKGRKTTKKGRKTSKRCGGRTAKGGKASMKPMGVKRLLRNHMYNCDQALYEVIGVRKAMRRHIIKRIWNYVHKHNLQDPHKKKVIIVDKKLAAICGPERKVGDKMNGFKLPKHIKKHVN